MAAASSGPAQSDREFCAESASVFLSTMPRWTEWSFGLFIAITMVNLCSGYRVVDHDLETAASDKKEWEKGDDEHYYSEDHEEKGEKAEKGYKGEHG